MPSPTHSPDFTHNRSLTQGLRALCQPATLLAVVVLLLNDHWLKSVAPSALTGKLSDFAGLFFFPFLLIVAFSLWPSRWRARPDALAQVAFALTALWFVAMKTTAWGNGVSAELWSLLRGQPVIIMRDPTDCIALLSLWPAWRLWRADRYTTRRPSRKTALAMLALASLAAVASSPGEDWFIDRVIAADGRIFARETSFYPQYYPESDRFFTTTDGVSWQLLEELPPATAAALDEPSQAKVCSTVRTADCYRFTTRSEIEKSVDGGASWQRVWRIQPGREAYRRNCGLMDFCRTLGEATDIAWLESAETSLIIVAWGTEGVVLSTDGDKWQRIGLGDTQPLPVRATSISQLFGAVETEQLILLLIFPFIYVLLSGVVLYGVATSSSGYPMSRSDLTDRIGLWPWFLVLPILTLIFLSNALFWLAAFSAVIMVAILFLIDYSGWQFASSYAKHPEHLTFINSSLRLSTPLTLTALTLFGVWLTFVLWAVGVIPVYNVALLLAIAVGVLLLWFSIWRLKTVLLPAAMGNAP